jgi:hypothetical protein
LSSYSQTSSVLSCSVLQAAVAETFEGEELEMRIRIAHKSATCTDRFNSRGCTSSWQECGVDFISVSSAVGLRACTIATSRVVMNPA